MDNSGGQLKPGSLVTVDLGEYSCSSNTYVVAHKLEGKCILHHPLAPECFIIKADSELNNVAAELQSPIEKCIVFAHRNKDALDYQTLSELEALKFYFVIKRELTNRQKRFLSKLCGNIAEYKLKFSLRNAVQIVNENSALLDEFNRMWFESFKTLFQNPEKVRSTGQKTSIYNIAGFILAQLEAN